MTDNDHSIEKIPSFEDNALKAKGKAYLIFQCLKLNNKPLMAETAMEIIGFIDEVISLVNEMEKQYSILKNDFQNSNSRSGE